MRSWRIETSFHGLLVYLAIVLAPQTHAGVTFTNPAPLNSNAAGDSVHDFMPRIATDRDDTFVVVWASQDTLNNTVGSDHDIFFSRSTDDGANWSMVATLNEDATTDLTGDQAPDIATDGTTWIAVWTSGRTAGAGDVIDDDIFYSRSTDGGAAWSAAAVLNTNATEDLTDADTAPKIFTDGAGIWICAWPSDTDLAGPSQSDTDIVFARSIDNGQSWSPPAYLNPNSDNALGNDTNPMLGVSADGTWVAVWDSDDTLAKPIGSDTDILAARSTDGGQTWDDFVVLNTDAATDEGAPPIGNDSGARVSSLGGTSWLATWHRFLGSGDAQILSSRSSNDGVTWTKPSVIDNPSSSSKGDDEDEKQNSVYFTSIRDDDDEKDKLVSPSVPMRIGIAMSDAVVESPLGNGQLSGHDYDLRIFFSGGDAKKWTRPEIANSNAFTDAQDDYNPEMAIDGERTIVLVWSSFDSLGSTIGTDADILVSTATYGGLTELLTPNGGEKWKRGKKNTIEWVTNVDSGESVRLNLLRKGNMVETITNSTPNDGKFKWKAPANLKKGGGYQVSIELNSDTGVNDESYYQFKVK